MIQRKWCFIAIVGTGMLLACFHSKQRTSVSKVLNEYTQHLHQASQDIHQFIQLIKKQSGKQELQEQFRNARYSYKRVEWLAEYYYPYTAKMINGPALDEVEADEKTIIVRPEGFQVIEEILFVQGDDLNKADLLQQAKVLQSNLERIEYMISLQQTTDAHIFDAFRLEIFRIIALGISGFDSPIANNSLFEAAASLEGLRHMLALYYEQLPGHQKDLSSKINTLFDGSNQLLTSSKDFNAFDRLKLITRYLNPISENILLIQQALKISNFQEPRVLKAGAKTLFAANIFNPDYYTPGSISYSNPDKVKLGEKLFYDGILSGDGKRNCASCHQPQKAFTDGVATSFAFNGKTNISRNAPTLINAALQPSLFYDTRVSYLEDQAKDVISNKDEMHGSMEEAVKHVSIDAAYIALFRKVYNNEVISEYHIKNSIAAYIRSLVKMDSRFDQYVRGESSLLNKTEIDGFNLFMGKAKCGTCHFVPLFNGSNPPVFDKIDAEVIGVPGNADTLHPFLDRDPGKFNLYKVELHRNAFKTPTLRNIELTAPYMHNGVYSTLEEVVEFYNRGGGIGLGLKLDNQTLPENKLDLTSYEKKSLIAFMRTLTDTSFRAN